jgi:hypothetical protein
MMVMAIMTNNDHYFIVEQAFFIALGEEEYK